MLFSITGHVTLTAAVPVSGLLAFATELAYETRRAYPGLGVIVGAKECPPSDDSRWTIELTGQTLWLGDKPGVAPNEFVGQRVGAHIMAIAAYVHRFGRWREPQAFVEPMPSDADQNAETVIAPELPRYGTPPLEDLMAMRELEDLIAVREREHLALMDGPLPPPAAHPQPTSAPLPTRVPQSRPKPTRRKK